MERNDSKPWDPHHKRTWDPTLTPAHLRTWPTLCHYPGDREGQYGARSCQSLAGALKCASKKKCFSNALGYTLVVLEVL